MDRVKERLALAATAIEALMELCRIPNPTLIEREAALLRMASAIEATWKAAQMFLRESEGTDIGSPNGSIRASRMVGLLDDEQAEAALEMIKDRNLLVHTYNEGLACGMFERLPRHADTLQAWLNAMREAR